MKYRDFQNLDVKNRFNAYPQKIEEKLLFLRELIFQIAEKTNEIGDIEETLKWESPSYLTRSPQSGTTIRLSGIRSNHHEYALSVHCQTTLIAEFKEVFPELTYDGNRSIVFNVNHQLPLELIKRFIYLALTYHYRKKHRIGI